MFGDPKMDDSPTVVGDQYEHEQHAAGERRHGEEVQGDEGRQVIRYEGAPGL